MTPNSTDFWFLPLGGTGEIGMNFNLYGHNGRWLIVDCGVTFEPELDVDGLPLPSGSQVQMADPTFIATRRHLIDGMVITHAHEDHVGGVPYLWPQLQCPIYTTPYTAEILRRKLKEKQLLDQVIIHEVPLSTEVDIGEFNVKWVNLTHSIPEPCGLVISTETGRVFHTADWKLDPTPVVGKGYSPQTYQEIGDKGIDVMVCDSTNATLPGWSVSEKSLYQGLKQHISQAKGRVVVTCFGSNIARLHTLARIAEETERHLGLLGRSLLNTHAVAKKTGYWHSQETFVVPQHLSYLPKQTLLLVATGSQGEPRTALNRLSTNSFRDLQLEPGDTVIFSSKAIPGNEEAIDALIKRLKSLQVDVITMDNSHVDIHASGHPAQEELKQMYQWIKPKCVIPVHGEIHHMKANAKVAKSVGVSEQIQGKNGDLFLLSPVRGIRRNFVSTGRLGLKGDRLKKIF